jgi:hypothetical protein
MGHGGGWVYMGRGSLTELRNYGINGIVFWRWWIISGVPPLPQIFSVMHQGVTPSENILQPQRARNEKQA